MENKTTKDIASIFNCDKTQAYYLITFLCGMKLAQKTGTKKQEGKRGKGESLYSIEDNAFDVLKDKMKF